MKLIFNTSNIDNVGVKIFFDDKLECELLINGGIYPLVWDFDGRKVDSILIELCHEKELNKPSELAVLTEKRNSELFRNTYNGASIDSSIANKRWQFAYKTHITEFDSSIKSLCK